MDTDTVHRSAESWSKPVTQRRTRQDFFADGFLNDPLVRGEDVGDAVTVPPADPLRHPLSAGGIEFRRRLISTRHAACGGEVIEATGRGQWWQAKLFGLGRS